MARATDPKRALAGATWVVRALRDAGHQAVFAGGCVRDALLNLHPTDYDVATDATPDRVLALFPRSDRVGAAFGVVLVHVPRSALPPASAPDARVSVEVATFRADGPYSDARRPDSVVFSDPVADAQRRDFTINALFLDPLAPGKVGELDGRVIDHVGGRADLDAGIIRAVGDPDTRLREDHLRALRAVRFAGRLGFTIEPGTAGAIARCAASLRGVSRERVGEELRRMLVHPARAKAVALLNDLGLDAPVLDEPPARSELRLLGALPVTVPFTTALAAWLLDRTWTHADPTWPDVSRQRGHPAPLSKVRAALCLSNDEHEALVQTLGLARHFALDWSNAQVAQQKRWAYAQAAHEACTLIAAWNAVHAAAIHARIDELARDGVGLAPEPLITGDDLVASGITPGPKFKAALERTYDAQLEGRVVEKAGALELARRLCV
jgi:poly(A) polymerase